MRLRRYWNRLAVSAGSPTPTSPPPPRTRPPPPPPRPAPPADAIALQVRLAPRVLLEGDPPEAGVRTVAGCDLAFLGRGRRGDTARAAAALLSYPDPNPAGQHAVEAPLTFPPVP